MAHARVDERAYVAYTCRRAHMQRIHMQSVDIPLTLETILPSVEEHTRRTCTYGACMYRHNHYFKSSAIASASFKAASPSSYCF